MEISANHYVQNGIHFYHGEPDVPSFVVHHHLSKEEANEITKHITKLKRNTRRRERYAQKKALRPQNIRLAVLAA
jgi:hypothetical protein